MNKLMEQALLYDFYGELLTEHQRMIYEEFTFQDLSLGEIAESAGISRQGVHDLIKRCNRQLSEYEAKLHLVEKFAGSKEKIAELQTLIGREQGRLEKEVYEQIDSLLKELSENF